MPTPQPALPRIAIQSIAGGLLLMAFFTTMWAGIARANLQGYDHGVVLIVFGTLCLAFISYGIKLFITARKFPKTTINDDLAQGRNIGKWFSIIFGIEGAAIPLTSVTLQVTGHLPFVLPAIALIVGLHFYPMAMVFKRTIDYYLATWTCLVALAGISMTANNSHPQTFILAFLGIGVALATASYGIYMLFSGYRLTNRAS